MTTTTEQPTKISAQVLADSMSSAGARIVTIEATYPRSIHSEIMTHRVFSRNTASSRAIPLSVTLTNAALDPFVPAHWGRNQKGMQAAQELDPDSIEEARKTILQLRDNAVEAVRRLEHLGLHKQLGNRYLEPWLWHTAIITSTEWRNFIHLRNHKDAEPHLADLAAAVYESIRNSQFKQLEYGQWHLPLILPDEMDNPGQHLAKVSAARCARTSYLTHHGVRDMLLDLTLYDRLLSGGHLSPLEHCAQPLRYSDQFYGNLRGWVSLRWQVPGEKDILAYRNEVEELVGLEGLN